MQTWIGRQILCQPATTQQPVWGVAASNIEGSFQTWSRAAKDSTWASPISELKKNLCLKITLFDLSIKLACSQSLAGVVILKTCLQVKLRGVFKLGAELPRIQPGPLQYQS